MKSSLTHAVAGFQHAIYRRFIWIIVSSYVVAAIYPTLAFETSGPLAPTSHQVAITKIAATVLYTENRCPHLKVNTMGLLLIGKSHKVSIDDWQPGGRLRPLLEAHVAILKAEHGLTNNDIFCGLMEAHYGPDGITAPGAMMRR